MTRQITSILFFATLIALQSCIENPGTQKDSTPPTKVQDLKIPANFDWITAKMISCTVNSNAGTKVYIYSDKACEQELLATVTTQGDSENILPLSVSKETTTLYLKYESEQGSEKIVEQTLNKGVVAFNITDGAQNDPTVSAAAKTRSVPVDDKGAYISYPAGWGTMMFEDLFPAMGDYDFNDFVASYQIAIEFPWKDGAYDTKHVNMIRVHLKLKALGGSFNFTPYVRIIGLNKNNISMPKHPYGDPIYVNPRIINNTTDGVEVNLVDSDLTTDAIIQFKNLNSSNPDKTLGAPFFNTVQGNTMKANKLTEVTVYLALSKEIETSTLLDDKIDIFLASQDRSNEIHARGFFPAFSQYDFKAKNVHETVPYASSNNLVWGLKVAKSIQHIAEKINFCEGYTDFANWAQSGGTANENWFETNVVKDHVIQWAK